MSGGWHGDKHAWVGPGARHCAACLTPPCPWSDCVLVLLAGMAVAAVVSVGNPAGSLSEFSSRDAGLSKSCGQVAADDLSRYGQPLRLVHRTALSTVLREGSGAAW